MSKQTRGPSKVILKSPLSYLPNVTAYLERVGGHMKGMWTASVAVPMKGYFNEVARIRFAADGTVTAPEGFEPTPAEAAALTLEISKTKFPNRITPNVLPALPSELLSAGADSLFWFHDINGDFLFLQHRIELENGQRAFIPYSLFDDGWRIAEPDGPLPLWGLDQLKGRYGVVLHEGAKAARRMRALVEGNTREDRAALKAHPFGPFLQHMAHLGWVGGAFSAYRTDWSKLRAAGIEFAIIVTDNDEVGRAALTTITRAIGIRAWHMQFTNEFPSGFDLGDDFPKTLYRTIGNVTRYVGPPPLSLIHPATWATERVPVEGEKKKSAVVLRAAFKGTWVYVEKPKVFASTEIPGLTLDQDAFDIRYSSLSDTPRLSRLVLKDFRGRIVGAAYRPDLTSGLITQNDTSAFNFFRPSLVEPSEGDIEPFLEFTRYLFPKPNEQREVFRWIATLISQPSIRMKYGLLLASETQGTGKSTLADLLMKIVGEHNCSTPTEADITQSAFNPWLARKRLVIVNEVYAGHSFKAYNTLKSLMTEPTFQVNEKNKPQYQLENYAHFIACSNSKKPLRMEDSDRRWLYPTVTEIRWPKQKFADLYDWLASGGLSIIAYWAHHFGDYVGAGDDAPNTEEKDELIAESRTPAERVAIEIVDQLAARETAACVSLHNLHDFARQQVKERVFDTIDTIRRALRSMPVHLSERMKVRGQLQRMLMNDACWEAVKAMCPLNKTGEIVELTADARDYLRSVEIAPGALHKSSF